VPVRAVDHGDARAYEPGQLEGGDACGEGLGSERMAERVRAAPGKPGRLKRRVPLPRPPRVEADVAASGGWEEERRIQPSGSASAAARAESSTRRRDRCVFGYGVITPPA